MAENMDTRFLWLLLTCMPFVSCSTPFIDILVDDDLNVSQSQLEDIVSYVTNGGVEAEVEITTVNNQIFMNFTSVCDLIGGKTTAVIIVTSCSNSHVVNMKMNYAPLPVLLVPDYPCTIRHLSPSTFLLQPNDEDLMASLRSVINTGGFASTAFVYDSLYDACHIEEFFEDSSRNFITELITRLPEHIDAGILDEWFHDLGNISNSIILMISPDNVPTFLQHPSFSMYHSVVVLPDLNVDDYRTYPDQIKNTVFLTEWIRQPIGNMPYMIRDMEARVHDSLRLIIEEYSGRTITTSCHSTNSSSSFADLFQVESNQLLLSSSGFDERRHRNNTLFTVTRSPDLGDPTGTWSRSTDLNVTDTDLFRQIDTGFHNITMVIGTLPAEPFIIKSKTGEYSGFCIDILDELALRLNFRYVIVEPEDGKWGGINPDGTWNGLVRSTMDRKFDMSIGPITMSAERENVVEYTTSILEDGAGIILRKSEDTYGKIFRSFKPFTTNVWITICCVLLAVGLTLGIVDKISPYRGKTREIGQKEKTTSIADDIWIVFGSYTEQGAEFTPANASGRFILGFWWIFTILIISSYTASLAAFLTVAFFDKPIKTIDDLAAQTDIKPIVKQGSNLYTLFKKGETERYQKLFELMSNSPEVYTHEEAIELVLTGNYAYLTDQSQLEFLQKEDCENLILGEEPFNAAGIGYIVPRGSPYVKQLSYNIIKLQEAGLIRKWRQKWWVSTESCINKKVTSVVQSLELITTSGPFIAFAGSTVLAIICLIVENITFRVKKARCVSDNMTVDIDHENDIGNGQL